MPFSPERLKAKGDSFRLRIIPWRRWICPFFKVKVGDYLLALSEPKGINSRVDRKERLRLFPIDNQRADRSKPETYSI